MTFVRVDADQPIVLSILDGSTIKALLDDEDEFAMLAENLFEELDTDESGKLSRSELGPAVMQLGLEQGVPPPAGELLFHAFFVVGSAKVYFLSSRDVQAMRYRRHFSVIGKLVRFLLLQ